MAFSTITTLQTEASEQPSRARLWTGRILWVLAVPFLLLDAGIHIANIPAVVEASQQLGIPPHVMPAVGLVQLACLILYVIPRTAPLGAVLLTGYLGGAVATNVLAEMPYWFALMIGAFVWGAVWCFDARVRNLLAPRAK